MDYQRQSILDEFLKRQWKIEEIIIPQAPNNWKEIEVIQIVKYGISVYLSIELDPTHRYLGYKRASNDYDVIIYGSDPLETSDYEKRKIVGELNVGKEWQQNLEELMTKTENYLQQQNKKD